MASSRASRAAAAIARNQAKRRPQRKDPLERAADAWLRRAGYDEKGQPKKKR